MIEIKTTSNERRPQIIKSLISQQLLIGSYSNLKLKLRGPNHTKKMIEIKMTFNGRGHQIIKSLIPQQLLIVKN